MGCDCSASYGHHHGTGEIAALPPHEIADAWSMSFQHDDAVARSWEVFVVGVLLMPRIPRSRQGPTLAAKWL
jgi:hypothetical protein